MIRSAYSFRNSVGSIEEIASRLKEIGWRHLPIADFGSTFAHGHLEGNDLLPVYGVSIAVSPAIKAKKPVTDDFVFLAKCEVASVNLLLTTAFEQFRYVPMLKYEQMREAEGVFKIAGHRARLDELKPSPDLYIGLSAACSIGYVNRCRDLGLPFVAMQNSRYPRPADRDFWEVLCGRGASGQTYPQHIMSDDEWIASFNGRFDMSLLEEAIHNRQMILAACEGVTIPRAKLLHPETDKTLRQLCEDGAKTLGVDLSNPVYAERLETELKVIEGKEFTDYFLIFSDFMQHARRETLCGPARGSSAGSLVCYLTGITSVNPIKHGLLFFRFLDPGRSDYPDIDCDISSIDREKVIDYLVQKYGRDRVAKLGTIANFQAKNTIDEVTKALQIPKFHANDVVSNVPKYAAGDDRSDGALSEALDTVPGKRFLAKYPEMDVVRRFGGHPRHAGTHAAGVLLTDRPIVDLFSVDARTNTAQTDLKIAEQLGALKADLLSLDNLSIFKEALDQIGLPHDHLETLDLADSRVFDVLNEGKFSGVFQLEGRAAQDLSRRITFTSLEDISSISAIARPGPLASGAAEQWVRRKTGREATSYVHPSLEPYLNETYGLLIYQEQVMLIAKELAGLDWMQVSALRKAIGKSMGDEAMSKFGEPFVDGLLSIGWPEDDARKFWKDIVGFGKYSFNKSHSLSYAIVTYWGLWLKAYYPLEFAAACLTHRDKVEAQISFLRELAKEGYTYTPIDPKLSTDKWRVVNGKLVGPLTLIKGLGPKKVTEILSARARGEPLAEKTQKLLSDPKTDIDALYPVQDRIAAADLTPLLGGRPLTGCGEVKADGSWRENVLCCGIAKVCQERDENEPQRQEDRVKRGQAGFMAGKTRFVEIRLEDETGTLYAKIGRNEFDQLAHVVRDVKPEDEKLLLVRGTVTPDIDGLLLVRNVRVVG